MLVSCCVLTAYASPQLFPFSSVKQFFARHSPSTEPPQLQVEETVQHYANHPTSVLDSDVVQVPASTNTYEMTKSKRFTKKYDAGLTRKRNAIGFQGPLQYQHDNTRGIDEQMTAESGFSGVALGGAGGGERVEFQMHGHQGPHSYKFGFDTGKGHNRQFRYEERDGHGHVKGHYGFYDKSGKLQHVHYSADHNGFHAGQV